MSDLVVGGRGGQRQGRAGGRREQGGWRGRVGRQCAGHDFARRDREGAPRAQSAHQRRDVHAVQLRWRQAVQASRLEARESAPVPDAARTPPGRTSRSSVSSSLRSLASVAGRGGSGGGAPAGAWWCMRQARSRCLQCAHAPVRVVWCVHLPRGKWLTTDGCGCGRRCVSGFACVAFPVVASRPRQRCAHNGPRSRHIPAHACAWARAAARCRVPRCGPA